MESVIIGFGDQGVGLHFIIAQRFSSRAIFTKWSAVECRTRDRESPGLFGAVSKLGHFHSLHDAPVHCINEAMDSVWNMRVNSLRAVCSVADCFPEKSS